MTRITFPLFGERDEISPYQMRQLVSALELRFQSIEANSAGFYDNLNLSGDDLDSRYSQIGHTHDPSEITGGVPSSIFDLDDISGTWSVGQTLIWNGTDFIPGSASGGASYLNDLIDVNTPAPTNGYVLTWESASLRWKAKANPAGISTLFALTDTDLTGQGTGDLLFNSGISDTWVFTGSDLRWQPLVGLNLGNAIGLSWYDTSFTSVQFAVVNAGNIFVLGDAGYETYIDGSATTISSVQTTISAPRIDLGNAAGTVDYQVFLRSGANDDAHLYFGETNDYYGGSIGIDATNNLFELRTHNLNATGQLIMSAPYSTNSVNFPGTVTMAHAIAGDPGTESSGVQINGNLYMSSAKVSDIGGSNAAQFILHRHSTTLPALLLGVRSKTDTSAHAVMADNDVLMTMLAAGWDGADSYSLSSEIRMEVDGTAGANSMPGQITFMTAAAGTEVPLERMRIRSTGNVEIDNDLTVGGDLTVDGTTTSINTSELNIADNIITLNSGATDPPSANAGLEIDRGGVVDNVSLRWNESTDRWQFTNDGTTFIDIPLETNATHTGEVTGATALTLDVTAITNKTDVVADSVDAVPIYDNTDGGIKRTALNSITDGGYF